MKHETNPSPDTHFMTLITCIFLGLSIDDSANKLRFIKVMEEMFDRNDYAAMENAALSILSLGQAKRCHSELMEEIRNSDSDRILEVQIKNILSYLN
jgi:hypothetical protein